MSEIIDKTYKLLDVLDNSEVIKKITYYKEKLSHNEEILSLIEDINKENNKERKVKLKQELYNNTDYNNYIESYNELFYIILKINKKFSEYTNTKEGSCNG